MARSHSTINVPGFGEVPIVALGTVDDSFGSGGFGSDDEEPIFLSLIQRRLRDRGGFFGFGGGSLSMLNSFSFGGLSTGLVGLRAMDAVGGGSAAAATRSSAAAANNIGSTAGSTSAGDTTGGDAGGVAPEQQQQQRPRPFGLMDLHNRVADLARSRVEILSRSSFSSHRGSPAGERAALPPASSDEDEDGQVGGDGDGSDDDADETDGDEDGEGIVDDLPDYGMDDDDDDSDEDDEQEEDDYSEYFDEENLNDEDMYDMFGSETTEAAFEAAEAGIGGGQNGSAGSSDGAGDRGQDPGAAARLGPRPVSGGSGWSRSSAGVGLSEEEEPLLAAHRAAEGAASHPRLGVYPRGGAADDVTEDAASRRASSTEALSSVPPEMAAVTGDAAAPGESEAQLHEARTSSSAAAPATAEAGPGPAAGGRRRGRGMAFAWAAAQFALSAVLAPLRIFMLVAGLSSGAVAAVTRPPRLPVAQRAHVPVVARSLTARVEEEGAAVAAARGPAERGQLPQPLQQPVFHQNDGMRRGSSGPGLASGAHTSGDQLAATGGAGPATASAASQDTAAAEPSSAASTSMASSAASAAGPSSPTPTPHGIAHRHEQQSPPPPPQQQQQQQLQDDEAASRRQPRALYVRPQIHFRRVRPVVVRPRQGGSASGAAAAVAALAPQAQGPVAGSPTAHFEALDAAGGSGSSPLPAPEGGPTEDLRNSGSEAPPEPAVVSAEPTSAVERDEKEAAGVCGGSGVAGSCGGSGGSSGGDAGGEQGDAWAAGKALALQETLQPGAAPAAQPQGADASAPGSSTANAAGLGEAGAAVRGEGCDPRRASAAVVAAPPGTAADVADAAGAPAAAAAAAQAGHIRIAAEQSRRLAWQGAAADGSNAAGVPPVAGSTERHSCDVGAEADEESVGSDGSEMDGLGSDPGALRLRRPRLLDADLERLLSRAGFRNPDPGELQAPGESVAEARGGPGGSRHQTPSHAPGLAGSSAAASAATAAAGGAGAGAGAAARGWASRIAAWSAQRGLPRPFGSPRVLLRAVTRARVSERPAPHQLRRQSDHPPQANSALLAAAPPGAAARVGGLDAGALGDAFNSGDAMAAMVATPVGVPLILRASRYQVPEASERLQRLLLRRAASMENLRTVTSRPPPPLGGADVGALLAAPPRSTDSPVAAASRGGGATMRAPTAASFEPRLLRLPDTELGVAALNMLSAAAAAGPAATEGASCGGSESVRGSRAPAAFAAAGSPDSGPWDGTDSEEEQQRRMRAALAVPGQPPAIVATALRPAARPEDGDGSGACSADGGHGARGRSGRGLDDGRWARSRLHQLGGSGLLGCSRRRPQRRPRRLAGASGAWENGAEGDGGTDSLDRHGGGWCYYYSDDGNTDHRALVAQTRPRAGPTLVDPLLLPRLDLLSRGGDRLGRWGPAAGGSGAGAGSDGVWDSWAMNWEAVRGLASPSRRLRIAWGTDPWVGRDQAGQEGEQGGGETGPGSDDHHSVVEGSQAVAAAARAMAGVGGGSPLAPAPQLELGTLAAAAALGDPDAASVHFAGVPCQGYSLDDESELEEVAARLSPSVVASAARLGAAALAGGASEQAAPAAAAAGPTVAGGGGGGGGADRPLSVPPLQPRSLESDGIFVDASDPESWARGPPALESEGESQEATAASRLDLTSPRRWLRQRCVGTPASAAPAAGGGGGGDGVNGDGAAAAGTAAAAAWTARSHDSASTSASSVEEQQLTSVSGDVVWGWAEAGAGIIRAPAEGAGSRLSWPTGEADGGWSDGGDSEASSDWWAAAQPALRSSGPVRDMAAGGAARSAAAADSRAARFTDEEGDDRSADEPRCAACADGGDLQLPRWSSDDGYNDFNGEEAGRATVDGGDSLDDGRYDSDDWRPPPLIDEDEDEGDGTGGGGGGGGQGAGEEEEEASEDGSGGLLPLLLDECSDAEGEEEGVGGANGGDEARGDNVRFSGDADTYGSEYADHLAGLYDRASADERLDERQAASAAPGGGGWRFHVRADPRVSQTDSDDGMPPLFDADSDASSPPRPVPQSRTVAGRLRIADPAHAAADVFASPSSRLPLRQQQPRRPSSSTLTVGSVTSDLSFGRGGSISGVAHDGGLCGGAGSFSVLRRAARAHGGGGSGLGELGGGGGGGGDNDSDDASSDDSMPPLVSLDSPIAGRPRAGGHRNRYDSPPPPLGSDSDTEPGLLRRPAWRAFASRQEALAASAAYDSPPPPLGSDSDTEPGLLRRPAWRAFARREEALAASAASAAAQGHRDPAAAPAGAAAGAGPGAPSAQSSLSGNPGTLWRAAVEALLQALLDVHAVTGSLGRGGAGGVSQAAAGLGSTMGAQMPAGASDGMRGLLRPRGAASGGAGAGGTSQIVASVVSISADVLGSVAPGSLLGIAIPAGALSGGGGASGGGGGGAGGGRAGGFSTSLSSSATGVVRLPMLSTSWRSYLPPEDSASGRHPNDQRHLPGSYEEDDIPAWAARFAPRLPPPSPPRGPAAPRQTSAAAATAGPPGEVGAAAGTQRRGPAGSHASDALAGWQALWEDFSSVASGEMGRGEMDGIGEEEQQQQEQLREGEEDGSSVEWGVDLNADDTSGGDGGGDDVYDDAESLQDSLPELVPLEYESSGDEDDGAPGTSTAATTPPPPPPLLGEDEGLTAVAAAAAADEDAGCEGGGIGRHAGRSGCADEEGSARWSSRDGDDDSFTINEDDDGSDDDDDDYEDEEDGDDDAPQLMPSDDGDDVALPLFLYGDMGEAESEDDAEEDSADILHDLFLPEALPASTTAAATATVATVAAPPAGVGSGEDVMAPAGGGGAPSWRQLTQREWEVEAEMWLDAEAAVSSAPAWSGGAGPAGGRSAAAAATADGGGGDDAAPPPPTQIERSPAPADNLRHSAAAHMPHELQRAPDVGTRGGRQSAAAAYGAGEDAGASAGGAASGSTAAALADGHSGDEGEEAEEAAAAEEEDVPPLLRGLVQLPPLPHSQQQQQQQLPQDPLQPALRPHHSTGPILVATSAGGPQPGPQGRTARGASAPGLLPLPPMPAGAGAAPPSPSSPPRGPNTISRYAGPSAGDSDAEPGEADRGAAAAAAANAAGGAGAGARAPGAVLARRNAVAYPRSVLLGMLEALRNAEAAMNSALHGSGRGSPASAPGAAPAPAAAAAHDDGLEAWPPEGPTRPSSHIAAAGALLCDGAFVGRLLAGLPGVANEPPAFCVAETVRMLSLTGVEAGVRA